MYVEKRHVTGVMISYDEGNLKGISRKGLHTLTLLPVMVPGITVYIFIASFRSIN